MADEKKTMDATLVEHIVNENAELKKNFGKLTEELDAVKADKDVVEKENADLKADSEEVAEKLKKLAKYEEMGSPEDLDAKLKKADESEKENTEFKELGDSPEDVKEALTAARNHLAHIRENFGTVPEIKKALTEAIEFRKQVDAIGSIADITEGLNTLKKIVEDGENAEKDAKAQKLADELSLSVDEVKKMLADGKSEDEIKSLYAKMEEAFLRKHNVTNFVKKEAVVLFEGKEQKDAGKKDDTKVDESKRTGSRLDRINERLSK